MMTRPNRLRPEQGRAKAGRSLLLAQEPFKERR